MKLLYILLLSFILTQSAAAQTTEINTTYFTSKEMPNMVVFLPPPPDSTQTAAINYDIERYYWGKQQRTDSLRRVMAREDISYKYSYFCEIFGRPMQMTLSHDSTPAIYKLIAKTILTARLIASYPKNFYNRTRPFVVFDEPTLDPQEDEYMRNTGSYPSGHTIRGWAAALVLAEICPEHAEDILLRGYQYGESRVIVGAHWQSDIQAGFLAASAAVAKLHTSPEFLKDLNAAKEEYRLLIKK